MTTRTGLFVTLEGGEGAGKSTAAAALAETLRGEGRDVLLTREPGGTPAAEAIRALLLGDLPLDPLAQTMLHFAARADHVAALIRPALSRGAVVICDRYADSTMAYQGFGLGVDVTAVASMIRLVDLQPDVTFILEVSDSVAIKRRESRGGADDRYERMNADTRARIANGFRAIAAADPSRCVLVDAGQSPEAVAAALRARLKERCGI
ncbi:MAG: dTMP kinase [Acidocella sp. 20-61-6]|nr:MAG: dTMP kinase [Acidocella sp. 20-61-6]